MTAPRSVRSTATFPPTTNAVDHVDRVGHGFVIEKGDPIVEVDRQQPHQCDQNSRDHADFATHVPSKERASSIRRGRFAAPQAASSFQDE